MRKRIVCSCLVLAACAAGEGPKSHGPGPDPGYTLKTPRLVAVSPDRWALGDTVQVVGSDFIDPAHGQLVLHFKGHFMDDQGANQNYEGDVSLSYLDAGHAQFVFGPSVFFSPTGDHLGSFTGSARVISQYNVNGQPTDRRDSNELSSSITVAPSVLLETLHSVDEGCEGVSGETIVNQNLAIGVRPLGLGGAAAARITFISPTIQATYSAGGDQMSANATSSNGSNTIEVALGGDLSVLLDPKHQPVPVHLSAPVSFGFTQTQDVILSALTTGPVGGPGANVASIGVEIEGGGGQVQRVVALNVFNQGEILPYDGNTNLVERYAAQQVSGCFPGGDQGRELQYNESQSESHSRHLGAHFNMEESESLGFTVGGGFSFFDLFSINASTTSEMRWSQSYGMDVAAEVQSSTSIGTVFSGHILPTYFGVCYRQTERVERKIGLVLHTACGRHGQIGEAVLTDWNYGVDIAVGPTCPPPTNLPPAQMFPDPDGGN
jgi:hypothetical protein